MYVYVCMYNLNKPLKSLEKQYTLRPTTGYADRIQMKFKENLLEQVERRLNAKKLTPENILKIKLQVMEQGLGKINNFSIEILQNG